jgi:NADH:ubiquinone oxidoreductase subunit E
MHSEPTIQELRELVAEFRPNAGHVMPALHKVQEKYGYISRPAIEVIARQLGSTPALIYGAVSFYDDYHTTPPPETMVTWCSGPTCRLLGGDHIREVISQVFELPLGGESEDHKFGFHIGQCNGTCHEAPMVWVNGKVTGPLTVSGAVKLARDIRSEGASE